MFLHAAERLKDHPDAQSCLFSCRCMLPAWQCLSRLRHLARYRVARLLHTAAQRLRKHTRRLGAFHAWNKCLNHLLALARAHQVCI